MKEQSAIKGIQDKGRDDGKIKLRQHDFKESNRWKIGLKDEAWWIDLIGGSLRLGFLIPKAKSNDGF